MVRSFDTFRPQSRWTTLRFERPLELCGDRYGLINLGQANPDDKCQSILVFGGKYVNGKRDGCMIFSGSQPDLEDGTLQLSSKRVEKDQKKANLLLEKDYFNENQVFSLDSSILTPAFVKDKVKEAATKAVLNDLRLPHSQLIAVVASYGCLHIFDKTNMLWIAYNP